VAARSIENSPPYLWKRAFRNVYFGGLDKGILRAGSGLDEKRGEYDIVGEVKSPTLAAKNAARVGHPQIRGGFRVGHPPYRKR
jgi:hypothetical protein